MTKIDWISVDNPPKTPVVVEDIDGDDVYIWHTSKPVLAKVKGGYIVSAIYIRDDPCMGEVWLGEMYSDELEGVVAWAELPE